MQHLLLNLFGESLHEQVDCLFTPYGVSCKSTQVFELSNIRVDIATHHLVIIKLLLTPLGLLRVLELIGKVCIQLIEDLLHIIVGG